MASTPVHRANLFLPCPRDVCLEVEGQCANRAIKMMMGMGTPRKNSSSERIRGLLVVGYQNWSRRRPPYVAARLALKAPTSSDTNSHSAP